MKLKRIRRLTAIMLSIIIVCTSGGTISFAEKVSEEKAGYPQNNAKRTILLYACGTDLETDAAMATYNLRQILRSNFSANDDVRFIVMTGGTDKWHLERENLIFPEDVYVPDDAVAIKSPDEPVPSGYSDDPKSGISNVYNQIWEVKGADAAENASKMVLVDGDGVMGSKDTAKRSMISADDYDDDYGFDRSKTDNYEWMNKPEVLKAFINYGVEHYPAEKYDLILWDHGGGPTGGFCSNQQEPGHGYFSCMTIAEMADAFGDNRVVDADGDGVLDGSFDFIDFDACLMSGVETIMAFSDYMDYYIASPETEPGYGQYYGPGEGQYTGWLDALGKDPEKSAFELGKIIVDDFIRFYDKESGDGSSQEGTLAVFDMKKILTNKVDGMTFVEALSLLDKNLEINLKSASYYDEFRSFKNSIAYTDETYHDLGNLLSQLAYAFDDLNYQDWKGGNLDHTNLYTDIAKILMGFICDEDVMYARSTKGIHTNEQFYMDKNGNMQYGEQPTSGLFIWFDPTEDPKDFWTTHHMAMMELVKQMKEKYPGDARTDFFENHLRTAEKYGIAYYAGKAVSNLISEGMDPEQVNYDAVWEYWNTHNNGSIYEPYDEILNHYFDCVGGEAEVKGWLTTLINEMRIEVVHDDKIKTQLVKTDGGTGYTITLNEVRKQAVDNIKLKVIAELPALKEFLNDPAHASYVKTFRDKSPGVTIGTLNATEVIDINPEKDGFSKTVDWLFDPTSTWTLNPPQTKWYALKDADGNIHVTAAEYDEKELDIPAGYATMELKPVFDENYEIVDYSMQEVWHQVWLIFLKDGNGNWNIEGLAFLQDNGSYRVLNVKEYQGEYELWPVLEFGPWDELVPISYKSFMLTPDTVGKLTPEFMELNEIGRDVADIDGDGKSTHNTVMVTNIYGYETDITDKVNNPTEDEETQVVDISSYNAILSGTSFEYTGKPIRPSVTVPGLNSDDYTVTFANNTKIGIATVTISAKGDKYKGTIIRKFMITRKTNLLKVKGKTASVRKTRVKKKTQKLKVSKVIKFIKKGRGKVTYVKKSGNKKITINKKTGKVTVKRGLKKGSYKVKVKVTVAGDDIYKKATKTVVFKIKVV